MNKFKSDLTKIRILLIILTLMQLGYIIIIFVNPKLGVKLDYDYYVNWLILGFYLVVTGIFIWFNWKKMPINKKRKIDNTFMILFLGIIGMWLWIPNKRETNQLIEKK